MSERGRKAESVNPRLFLETLPVRLTAAEMRLLVRAAREVLDGEDPKWGPRVRDTLAQAVEELGRTIDFDAEQRERLKARGINP